MISPWDTKLFHNGKMLSVKKGLFLQDIFGEIISSTTSHESDIYEYNNVKVDTRYDADACVEVIDNDLAIDEGNVEHVDSTLITSVNDKITDDSSQNDMDFSVDAPINQSR